MAYTLLLLLTAVCLQAAGSTTMRSPSTLSSAVTTAGSRDTEGKRSPSLVILGAMIRMVVTKAVLITAITVLLIFLWWKKSSRLKPEPQAADPVIPWSS
nr:paired immunoglobulin-like type 2 receptor beta-2 [Meriones unguiculatus]